MAQRTHSPSHFERMKFLLNPFIHVSVSVEMKQGLFLIPISASNIFSTADIKARNEYIRFLSIWLNSTSTYCRAFLPSASGLCSTSELYFVVALTTVASCTFNRTRPSTVRSNTTTISGLTTYCTNLLAFCMVTWPNNIYTSSLSTSVSSYLPSETSKFSAVIISGYFIIGATLPHKFSLELFYLWIASTVYS